jgi:hypothetical protein
MTYFILKDIKVKGWKKIFHINSNQKRNQTLSQETKKKLFNDKGSVYQENFIFKCICIQCRNTYIYEVNINTYDERG